jgi:hypothetical protein
MIKNYFIKNFSKPQENGDPELIYIHGPKELLEYIDAHKDEAISVYEAECVIDWS